MVAAGSESAFIGRRPCLDALASALDRGMRCLTIFGPPGIGKTRLARELVKTRRDRSITTSLALCHGRREICAAIARAASSPLPADFADDDAARFVTGLLAANRFDFVVLDNADAVVEPLRELLDGWLGEVAFVVTSREIVGVTDEHVLELEPLPIAEGRELFVARASRWLKDGRAPSWPEAEIEAVVRALDGIPLAIELAAGRAHTLAPGEMARRLDARFEWLVRPGSLSPRSADRHATLWSAIDASFELLTDREREALVTLSLFSGTFETDDASAVLDERDALAVLDVLRHKSLLAVDTSARAEGAGSASRYRMLESIREFARGALPLLPDGGEGAKRRFVRALADEAKICLEGFSRRGFVAVRPLVGEGVADLEWALRLSRDLFAGERRQRSGAPFTLLAALCRVLELEITAASLEAILVSALEGDFAGADDDVLAFLHMCLGDKRGAQGDVDGALAELERAAVYAQKDARALAEIHVLAAVRLRQRGEVDEAERRCRGALALLGDAPSRDVGMAAANLGLVLSTAGRHDEARVFDEQAIVCFEACGDRWGEALALGNLAQIAQERGRPGEARRHLELCLDRLRSVGDTRYEAIYTWILGSAEHEDNALDEAERHYRIAADGLARLRVPHAEGVARACLGALLASRGRSREAEEAFASADRALFGVKHPAAREALRIHRLHLAPASERDGTPREAAAALEVTFACRLLARRTDRSAGPVLAISADGCAFSYGELHVDITRRGALRRILRALVDAKKEDARALSASELVEAGWPGEKMNVDAASNRLRVALATLRKLGLAGALLTREGGYMLAPEIVPL